MQKISELLRDIRPEVDFSNGKDFVEEGLLDSLDVIRLISELENNFGVSINGVDIVPENFADITTIENLIHRSKSKE